MPVFHSLLAVIFLTAIPYGSNRPWAWSLASLLIALLGFAWAVTFLLNSQKTPFSRHGKALIDVLVLFSVAIGWIFIQASVPFVGQMAHPLWQMSGELIPSTSAYISLAPQDSLTVLMRFLSYAVVFWLTLSYCQDTVKAKRVFYAIMWAGFVCSVWGLVMHLGGLKPEDTPYFNDVTGTFISRNHFATYAGLSLLCALALLSDGVTSAASYNVGGNLGLQRFLENLIVRSIWPALIFFVTGTALILSHSRGGFLSGILGLVILLLALNINKRSRNIYLLWFFVAFVVIGGIVFYVSSDGLLDRFNGQGLNDESREKVAELTWNAVLSNPWTGFGSGSFEEAFTLYKTIDVAGTPSVPLLWDFAHNLYLENMFELGIPAAAVLFYCILRLATVCVRGLLVRKRNWIYPATGLAATCLVAFHSYVDFSMAIPAVPYTYFLLMGAACAQSFSSRKKAKSKRQPLPIEEPL